MDTKNYKLSTGRQESNKSSTKIGANWAPILGAGVDVFCTHADSQKKINKTYNTHKQYPSERIPPEWAKKLGGGGRIWKCGDLQLCRGRGHKELLQSMCKVEFGETSQPARRIVINLPPDK